jgi:hypothetical protein
MNIIVIIQYPLPPQVHKVEARLDTTLLYDLSGGGEYFGVELGTGFCVTCPPGADCTEGGQQRASLKAQRGFYEFERGSLLFQPCAYTEACTSGDEGSVCAEGYTGTGCSKCERSYWSGPNFECQLCHPDQSVTMAGVVLSPIVMVKLLSHSFI